MISVLQVIFLFEKQENVLIRALIQLGWACFLKRIILFTLLITMVSAGFICQSLAAGDVERQTPPEPNVERMNKHDSSLMISLEAVLQGLSSEQKIVLVDVRGRKEFNRFRIPCSINIPLHFIKTKTFLRTKFLVLVNEGYCYSQLENECHRLKSTGFKVAILNGGLNCWRQHQGPLKGDRSAQKSLNKIPPPLFFQEKEFGHRLVIDVSESPHEVANRLIPNRVHIPFLNDPEKAAGQFIEAVAKQRKTLFLSVLIFNQDGERYDRIEKLIEKTGVKNVFYLEGGLKEYRSFLHKLTLSRKPKNKRIKSLKKCKTCGQ